MIVSADNCPLSITIEFCIINYPSSYMGLFARFTPALACIFIVLSCRSLTLNYHGQGESDQQHGVSLADDRLGVRTGGRQAGSGYFFRGRLRVEEGAFTTYINFLVHEIILSAFPVPCLCFLQYCPGQQVAHRR
jgi:hypothetical protein